MKGEHPVTFGSAFECAPCSSLHRSTQFHPVPWCPHFPAQVLVDEYFRPFSGYPTRPVEVGELVLMHASGLPDPYLTWGRVVRLLANGECEMEDALAEIGWLYTPAAWEID